MQRAASVLIVEDDDLDAEALERAFVRERTATPRYRARNGEEALAMLRGGPGSAPIPGPHLVLLDLNMPRMNGLEFLAELRSDARLRRTVTFVLTTSEGENDRLRAYALGIAGYLVKSRTGLDFRKLTDLLASYDDAVVYP
ncbi:MAG: response regulator [Myxococcota bacterium]